MSDERYEEEEISSEPDELSSEPDEIIMPNEIEQLDDEMGFLMTQVESGAKWFYWVAALSMVNTVILLVGGEISFIFGLGITQLVDGVAIVLAEDLGTAVTIAAFVFNLLTTGFVAFLGFKARNHRWAFNVGMVLYILDALLFVLFQDWLSLAFHGYVLVSLFKGLKALNKYNAMVWAQENPVEEGGQQA